MEPIWMKIGEAARRLGVTPKELRYWERIIPEIQPRRSQGNLRYYHVDELERLQQIRNWVEEGLTVSDCRQLLLTGQLTRALDLGLGVAPALKVRPRASRPPKRKPPKPAGLAKVVAALKRLAAQLNAPPAWDEPDDLDRRI